MASLRTDYDDVDYEESKNHEHSDSNRFTATDFAAARDALRLKSQAVMLSEPTSPSPNHPPNVPSNPGATTGNNVDYDLTCGICLDLNMQPVQLPCKHLFCQCCLQRLSMYGTSEYFQCPLCRFEISRSTNLRIHKPTLALISNKYPHEHAHFQDEQRKEASRPKPKIFQIVYGNRHNKLQTKHRNKHNWIAFVEIFNEKQQKMNPQQFISQVHFNFHQYFTPVNMRPKSSNQGRLEVSRNGWGSFDYIVTITFVKELGLDDLILNVELSFERTGVRILQPLTLMPDQINKLTKPRAINRPLTVDERRAKGDAARNQLKQLGFRSFIH